MDPAELDLRIVPLHRVLLHEGHDPHGVARMVMALEHDGMLRHPPIVTQLDTDPDEPLYVVLDGATRTTALRKMGSRDILVQVVDYASPHVSLSAWNHLLQGIAPEDLLAQIHNVPGAHVVETDTHHADAALAVRQLLCYFILRDHSVWGVRADGDLAAQTEVLNQVVNVYRGHAELFRVVTTQLDLLLHEYPEMMALVVFPRYSPAEVLHLALSNAKVPMGITRHLIGGRVLNVTVALETLMSDEPLAQKNACLQDWLRQKVHARKVRFYGEPLFVIEE
ncbi:MAG: hypothetical protein HY741_15740 [Chloroflexi bacterium]|nr:hypothetical protein [Chloroflexota bacterium]